MWAGRARARGGPACRINLPPCYWRVSGAGLRDAALSPPIPAPPLPADVFGFSTSLSTQRKETPEAATETPEAGKASPTAAPPTDTVTSRGGASWSRPPGLDPGAPPPGLRPLGTWGKGTLCTHAPHHQVLQSGPFLSPLTPYSPKLVPLPYFALSILFTVYASPKN